MKKKLYSIIIPIKNQEKSVESNLLKLIKKLKNFKRFISWEIILVDDGSTDKTVKNIIKFKKKYKFIKLAQNFKNRGKG